MLVILTIFTFVLFADTPLMPIIFLIPLVCIYCPTIDYILGKKIGIPISKTPLGINKTTLRERIYSYTLVTFAIALVIKLYSLVIGMVATSELVFLINIIFIIGTFIILIYIIGPSKRKFSAERAMGLATEAKISGLRCLIVTLASLLVVSLIVLIIKSLIGF